MAASSDDSEDDNFVVLGSAVPELAEGESQKKPTTVQDLTARDKQGRRRFHGAFTGGFSAGYFNTVGTKEGFTPSTFISSRSQKNEGSGRRPEDFMDEEDFEEHGIAPRKFATVANYTSEERKRKLNEDSKLLTATGHVNLLPVLTDLVVPEKLPIGIKLLRKMGWREGQGLGPRVKKKKKKSTNKKSTIKSDSISKVYGCARPPSDLDDSDSDSFVPENMLDITFAPKDVCPISLDAKDNVHGLGYRGLDPSLALPGSNINLFDTAPPVRSSKGGKGIRGQAFGVGAFEDEDEDIYTMDNMSNYDITMQLDDDEVDSKFGWTAPRKHGKQAVPVSYVGKLLEGFTLSSQPLAVKKKFPPPVLPPDFKPLHWFRKRREVSHLPASLTEGAHGATKKGNITAVDRGLILGETPIIGSVFDLVPKEEKARIEATKQAIAITQGLASKAGLNLTNRFQPAENSQAETNTRAPLVSTGDLSDSSGITNTFLAKFKPAGVTHVEPSEGGGEKSKVTSNATPMFQGSLSFQPFRKDSAKQARYDTYLTSLKQGINDPYSTIGSSPLTEWEKARERDEFSKAAKIFRPMSALMSSRFVRGAMIDEDRSEVPLDIENEKSDRVKAAEMKMFGKLTREEFEWHPDKLLCRRFNVPNPYPGSDLVGLPTVKRDKYSVFNFLSFGDYQPGEFQEAPTKKTELELEPRERTMKSVQSRKATMTSIFKVLDDPDFHKPAVRTTTESQEKVLGNEVSEEKDKTKGADDNETLADQDLFRAIFKNSDSESSSDESVDDRKDEAANEEEENTSDKGRTPSNTQTDNFTLENIPPPPTIASTSPAVPDSEVVPRRPWSQRGGKSVFSVLDDIKQEPVNEHRQNADGHINTETILSRLSPPADDGESGGEYGPSLPPPSSSTVDSASFKHTSESEKIDRTEKTRDRHKHRKEKKKKSKHKKEKKHKKHRKSSKSRKSHKEDSGSGSEADTEDSDVSDSELLRRLKEVSRSATKVQLWKQI